MKVPKSQVNYQTDIHSNFNNIYRSLPKPTNRYRNTTKLYQLNLSKMLLKSPQATSPLSNYHKKDSDNQNQDQLVIVSTNCKKDNNIDSSKDNHKSNPLYGSIPKRNNMQRHRKNLVKKLQEIAGQLLRKQGQKQHKLNKQRLGQRQQIDIGASLTFLRRTNIRQINPESQLLISQKKLHDQQSTQKQILSPERMKNIKRHTYNTKNDFSNRIKLPQLSNKKKKQQQISKTAPAYIKTNKKVSNTHIKVSDISIITQNTNVPILTKQQDDLKIVKTQSYAVLQYPSKNLILSNRGQSNLQIASLTKIMTFYSVRKLTTQFSINISSQLMVITSNAMQMTGTSAQVIQGQVYSIQQLLYGLMLPSGNDAALALAEWSGQFILNNLYEFCQKFPSISVSFLQTKSQNKLQKNSFQKITSKQKLKAFLCFMNFNAKELNLSASKFANPHGLPHPDNKSTAIDVCKICAACLDDQVFIKVCSTQKFSCTIYQLIDKNKENIVRKSTLLKMQESDNLNAIENNPTINKYSRVVQWQNTNKLLRRPNFIGTKTGITVTAGPCLATAYRFRDKVYITVLLRSSKVSRRFKQTRKILCWCLQKLYKNSLTNDEKRIISALRRNQVDLDSDYSEDEPEFNYDTVSTAQLKKRSNFINYQM